ncbi:hypothetical protein HF673_01090 [Acidithiobacillus thiooxidans]|uniref:hypothetical protein n=1 Tax=Acidithiobacillus thiooxidans TaxID=930 RepID=UPI001C07D2F3|nr:hypothetical protein [Acidithiobacillus thiooxidans]MBU2834410.1 hypothetical protein [Acidithiobacillus thiooxidans]
MTKRITVRIDDGVYMVLEANANKNHQTVVDWIRSAIEEKIKSAVHDRAIDRIDERVYRMDKTVSEIQKEMRKVYEALNKLEVVSD